MLTAQSHSGTLADIWLFASGGCLFWAILSASTVSWMRRGAPHADSY
jgi:hypothetical protein